MSSRVGLASLAAFALLALVACGGTTGTATKSATAVFPGAEVVDRCDALNRRLHRSAVNAEKMTAGEVVRALQKARVGIAPWDGMDPSELVARCGVGTKGLPQSTPPTSTCPGGVVMYIDVKYAEYFVDAQNNATRVPKELEHSQC